MYILTFSEFKKHYEGLNYHEVKNQLTEFAELRNMYICPVKLSSQPAVDIDVNRINVYYLKDGTITRIEKDEYDV